MVESDDGAAGGDSAAVTCVLIQAAGCPSVTDQEAGSCAKKYYTKS